MRVQDRSAGLPRSVFQLSANPWYWERHFVTIDAAFGYPMRRCFETLEVCALHNAAQTAVHQRARRPSNTKGAPPRLRM